uniref:DNA excision repair protein ERCC-6-like n=1 Tax=Myxine glutinosa TaxID=7769 RepID=UPI00358F0B99
MFNAIHAADMDHAQEDMQRQRVKKYMQKAKEEARTGNLTESLQHLQVAYRISPTEKIESKIHALEEAIKVNEAEVEGDEFVNVLDSGFQLFHELHSKLYPYQCEGIVWLYTRYCEQRSGCILADDMGLGKTIQVVSFLSGMYDADKVQSVLIVVPTTLISNWKREFQIWAAGIRVKEFHGTSKTERLRNLMRVQRIGGVILTSYSLLVHNWHQVATYNGKDFVWDVMILDEGHKIKNSSSQTAKAVRAIPSKFRIALTGTPIQNNLQEMWALVDFVCQGSLLGTRKTFKMEYDDPISRARQKDATVGEKALGMHMSENLQALMKPYFLRRTKAEVQLKATQVPKVGEPEENGHEGSSQADGAALCHQRSQVLMPSLMRKNDLIIWVYLSDIQKQIYTSFVELDQIKELLATRRSPLSELNVLKKLCDHPRLLSARACNSLGLDDDLHTGVVDDKIQGSAFDISHVSDESLLQESGKLVFLFGLLKQLRHEGHKTLIFSQSCKMLDIIQRILKNAHFKVIRVDGTIRKLGERDKLIHAFQNDSRYEVFLLTIQVGGVGLTLTAANRVVIFDPSWNPAIDAQAIDRAYRIGQAQNVVIYRLITCGTVEEKIYRRQVFKESIIRQSTGDEKNPMRYFTQQDLRELFVLDDTHVSQTQQQLQKLHGTGRKTDLDLDEHIAFLHSLDMFGISDHDLMHTGVIEDEDSSGTEYIKERVRKAEERILAESEVQSHVRAQIFAGTEPPVKPNGRQKSVPRSPKKSTNHARPTINTDDVSIVTDSPTNSNEDLNNVTQEMLDLSIDKKDDEEMNVVRLSRDGFTSELSLPSNTTGDDDLCFVTDRREHDDDVLIVSDDSMHLNEDLNQTTQEFLNLSLDTNNDNEEMNIAKLSAEEFTIEFSPSKTMEEDSSMKKTFVDQVTSHNASGCLQLVKDNSNGHELLIQCRSSPAANPAQEFSKLEDSSCIVDAFGSRIDSWSITTEQSIVMEENNLNRLATSFLDLSEDQEKITSSAHTQGDDTLMKKMIVEQMISHNASVKLDNDDSNSHEYAVLGPSSPAATPPQELSKLKDSPCTVDVFDIPIDLQSPTTEQLTAREKNPFALLAKSFLDLSEKQERSSPSPKRLGLTRTCKSDFHDIPRDIVYASSPTPVDLFDAKSLRSPIFQLSPSPSQRSFANDRGRISEPSKWRDSKRFSQGVLNNSEADNLSCSPSMPFHLVLEESSKEASHLVLEKSSEEASMDEFQGNV